LIRIVLSRCLGLDSCRYNGEKIDAPWLKELASFVEVVSVCPEVEIGLGIPRKPLNLVKNEKSVLVIQDRTGIDLSDEMISFSQRYLKHIGYVDAFVLKSRSPSCGLGTTKIQKGDVFIQGSGIFAFLAKKYFPKSVFVDESFVEREGVKALMELIMLKHVNSHRRED
jgi:uncharacterized protein YbbK (DUF523 family)